MMPVRPSNPRQMTTTDRLVRGIWFEIARVVALLEENLNERMNFVVERIYISRQPQRFLVVSDLPRADSLRVARNAALSLA